MKPKDTFSLNTVDWSVKMLFKWVISSWGWREDRRKLYQSKRRFLRLKRVRIWCQWLRYSGTRLCCASGRSVIDLGSCCQLELWVDCLFSIGVDFIFLVFRYERKKKKRYTSIKIEYLQCGQNKSYVLFHMLWTYHHQKLGQIQRRLQNKMVTLTRNIWKIRHNCY